MSFTNPAVTHAVRQIADSTHIRPLRRTDFAAWRTMTLQRLTNEPDGTFGVSAHQAKERSSREWHAAFDLQLRMDSTLVAATTDQQLVATAALHSDDAGNTWLVGVWSDPAHRNDGLATRLVRHTLNLASPAAPIQLWVAPTSTAAIRLYRRLAFHTTGQRWAPEPHAWLHMYRAGCVIPRRNV